MCSSFRSRICFSIDSHAGLGREEKESSARTCQFSDSDRREGGLVTSEQEQAVRRRTDPGQKFGWPSEGFVQN